VAFYLWPLSSTLDAPHGPLRRGFLWGQLFLADELVARWLTGVNLHAVTQRLCILAYAALLLSTAWAAGWLCLRGASWAKVLDARARSVFAAAVGLQLMSLTTLALGCAGWLDARLIFGLMIAVLLSAITLGVRDARRAKADVSASLVAGGTTAFGKWALIASVPFLVVLLLGAMLPPLDFDVREYHLQAPKEFYQLGRITFLPHNVYANMPLAAEMFALLGMVLTGDWWLGALVGKTVVAGFAPLTAYALWCAGQKFATPLAGAVAGLVYISLPWVSLVSTQGLNEGAVGFFLFMALYAMLLWRDSARGPAQQRLLALAGVMAGAAMSCKYPALIYSVLPLAAWIAHEAFWSARRMGERWQDALREVLRPLGIYALCVIVSCGGWLLKNAVLAGNPVYPLAYTLLDGVSRTPEKDRQWTAAHRPPNYAPADFVQRAVSFVLGSDWLSPILMPLAALACVGRATRRLGLQLLVYVLGVFVAWWLLTHRLERFWVPLLCIVALLAGLGATWSTSRAWHVALAIVLALGLVSNFIVIAGGALGDNRYLADLTELRHDPAYVAPWHAYLNHHAQEVTGVLLVGDAQPFDLEVPAVYNTVFDSSMFEQLARERTPREVSRALGKLNISHVFVDWGEISRYRSPGNYGITEFLQPKAFQRLTETGVLVELPPLPESTGQMFRVQEQ